MILYQLYVLSADSTKDKPMYTPAPLMRTMLQVREYICWYFNRGQHGAYLLGGELPLDSELVQYDWYIAEVSAHHTFGQELGGEVVIDPERMARELRQMYGDLSE